MKRKLEASTLCPITLNTDGIKKEINVWNRKYTLSDSPLLSSIISNGQELLASPMRLVGTENGKELVISDVKSCFMHGEDGYSASACQYMQTPRFIINTTLTAEYDGCMDWHVTVATHGPTVAQAFGLAQSDKGDRLLTRLWLEIPLKKECAISYQYAPIVKPLINGEYPDTAPELCHIGEMPSHSLTLPFVHQVFLSNDSAGFAVFFESDENWQPESKDRVIECVREDDCVILRLRLLDSEPVSWYDKGNNGGHNLMPLSFRIGMQATPVKPFPADPYKERNVHIDCFKKIPQSYEEFLFKPFEDTDEIVIDRIKRLGVNTLYIHEKWNDIQNSPFLTEDSANRLKLIVSEAHKRGMKVIPYFGYEISSLSPRYSEDYLYSDMKWHWYRYPWQRAPQVCYNSGWQDIFVEQLEKIMDEFGFDGLYLDSITTCRACKNEKHGCGYRDREGNLHETYPVFAVRKLMKRLCEMVERRGGTICTHSSGNFAMATMAFSHCFWDGETVQCQFLNGTLQRAPEGYYRSMYTGRNIGLPINMLCYSNPPKWTFRQAMSNALPYGIIPKPVDVGEPLEDMSRLWNVLDGFSVADARWMPYFNNAVKVSSDAVRFSYYEREGQMLAFVANMVNEPSGKVSIELPIKVKQITDAISGELITDDTACFSLELGGFDHKILKIKL